MGYLTYMSTRVKTKPQQEPWHYQCKKLQAERLKKSWIQLLLGSCRHQNLRRQLGVHEITETVVTCHNQLLSLFLDQFSLNHKAFNQSFKYTVFEVFIEYAFKRFKMLGLPPLLTKIIVEYITQSVRIKY